MATIPTIQLFRNSIIKTGRQAAIDALEAQKASVPDGGLILARYSSDGKDNNVKTLLGIVRNSGSANAELTVIDVEGAAENVQKAIEKAINGLNQVDSPVDGQYVSSVSEENGIITVTRKDLPSLNKTSDSGKAITAITQTKGLVSVEFGGVAAANVSVADTNNKFTATNVEDTLLEIKTSLDNAIGTGGSVAEQITNAINDLDSSATSENNYFDVTVAQENGKITSITVANKDIASATLLGTKKDAPTAETAFGRIAKEVADREAAIKALNFGSVGGNGQVITTISQTDGKVSATAATLSADNVAFTSSDTAFTSNNVSAALDTLYTRSGDGSKVTLEDAEGSEGSNVLKVYTIKQGGTKVGEINIPKDLVVTSGSVVKGTWNGGTFTEEESGSGTALKLVIANQSAPVYINTLDLVKDHTSGNGIAISDTNVISVKIAEGSEKFLSVDEKGVKLSGVQAAINTAAAAATTKVEKTGEGSHITVASSKSNSDSSVTYTISESDIASANALTAETTARESADTALSNRLGDGVTSKLTATAQFTALNDKIEAETTARTNADNDLLAQLQTLSGTSASLSGDTSVNGAKKYTDGKIEALDLTQVGGADKVITTISQADGKVSASAIDLTANNVKATASTGVPTAVDVAGETVSEQIASLATSIKSASTAAAAAHTVVNAKPDGHVKVTVSSENSHDVVTITENDIASAAALATETTARQTQDNKIEAAVGLDAEGNHITPTGNYTKGATTVVGEIAALDTKLKEVSDTLGTGVTIAEGKTVTAQLQALSGTSESNSGDTSVKGAKKYTDAQIANLNATITGTSDHVDVTVAQANGKITSVTVANKDIASATALTAEANTRESADTELSNKLGTGVTTAEGETVTAQLKALSGETSDKSDATSVNGAKAYAKKYADDLVNGLDATITSSSETTEHAITIVQTDGKLVSITLGAFDCGTY